MIRRFILFSILLTAVPAFSQTDEHDSTIITSVRLEMQGTEKRNFFYFTGEVKVKGTNLELFCEELTVVAMREGPDTATVGRIGAIEEIVARGSVEIHQAGRSAYAGHARVDPQVGTVTLSDNPRIVDGEVQVEGYQFVLHRGEKKFESVPDPNAPADMPSRSVVRLGAMPDLGFDQPESAISIDERISPEPVVPAEETPSGEVEAEGEEPATEEGDAGGNP